MSLVYNNDKPIGKCESYSIDKIHGTTPFVMLTNYEPLRSELTDDQQVVLEALKVDQDGWDPFFTIWHMMENDEISNMPTKQQFQVLAAFAEWGCKSNE